MKKIEFYNDIHGVKDNKPFDNKYILLCYYLSDRKDIKTIERIINELKTVQSKEKTFEEVFEEVYGTITISVSAGEFECNKDTAYFISNNPEAEPNIEMPLQELIDLLEEWKAFLSN